MSLALGRRLNIRAMVHVAGEPIPFFWPMRTFIHHNPLHGLEDLPFTEAVRQGERLFHARGYLPRSEYQAYLAEGKIDLIALSRQVAAFVAREGAVEGIDVEKLFMTLLTATQETVTQDLRLADARDVHSALAGLSLPPRGWSAGEIAARVKAEMPADQPIYAALDKLFDTEIGATLDELAIKSCLDFFDEGQSVWHMPGRRQGFFAAWSALAQRNLRLFLRGLHISHILESEDTPEGIISYVMRELRIPEENWIDYFTQELTRLHGWTGFIRWRSATKHYYWTGLYPADLVDYLAMRMVLGLSLIREHAQRKRIPDDAQALDLYIDEHPQEAFLRQEFYSGRVLPEMAHAVEDAIASSGQARVAKLFPGYAARKREHEAHTQAATLLRLAERAGLVDALRALDAEQISTLLRLLRNFEREEGQVWLCGLERHYMDRLLAGLQTDTPAPREKRPFAQILFCIDVRSERIRRHLEKIGDYQTFGIAGFFGIPVSFVGLEKGSETHLCPVVVTPKNLVLELSISRSEDREALMSVLEHVFHELKASVLSPYITVEAIGLLFGLDMFGKTFAPSAYQRWRARLHPEKVGSRLLLDKLTREQADSIIRSLQRAMIVNAIGRELNIAREDVTDEMIRALRETALGHQQGPTVFAQAFNLDEATERDFIARLQRVYRIERGYVQLQMERLGRIGFTLDEQVHFVSTALRSIGLTQNFSRFVLLVGHGSTSDNNPYESALDCGACGGNHGIINARVLAQIVNKPAVRERLRAQGISIADDAWFVPAFHNTTTDELRLHDLDLLPPSHLVYLERLSNGLQAGSRLSAAERIPTLAPHAPPQEPARAFRVARRNAYDWSQVRPEWGLSRNAAFIIGRRHLTEQLDLQGRVFLHSYDYRCDRKERLLENILTGPLVVGQWINMEHYFSTVDNQHYGSGSKVYHNVAGHFAVMTGNLSDLRTGLPSQTVLQQGRPYHQPIRLITMIEAPFERAKAAVEGVVQIRKLVKNGWIRMAIIDPETGKTHVYEDGIWHTRESRALDGVNAQELTA